MSMIIQDPCKVCLVVPVCERYINKCDQALNYKNSFDTLSKVFVRTLVVWLFFIPISQIYLKEYISLLIVVWSAFALFCIVMMVEYRVDKIKRTYKRLDNRNQRPIKPPPPPPPPPKRKFY